MPATYVRIDHGSEGPDHDPYSYVEINVERLGRKVTFHGGLGDWVEVDGVRQNVPDNEMVTLLVQLTGGTPYQWEKWVMRARSRCKKCGSRNFFWQNGMPGESFKTCSKCEEIIHTDFNLSAII